MPGTRSHPIHEEGRLQRGDSVLTAPTRSEPNTAKEERMKVVSVLDPMRWSIGLIALIVALIVADQLGANISRFFVYPIIACIPVLGILLILQAWQTIKTRRSHSSVPHSS